MRMPPLDPLMADVIADTGLSLAAFMREDVHGSSLAFLSREARPAIRAWIMAMFREIHRILRALEGRPQLLRVAAGGQGGGVRSARPAGTAPLARRRGPRDRG